MPTFADKFWAKVSKPNENGCREWAGAIRKDGYGSVRTTSVSGIVNGNHTSLSHRVAWVLIHGIIPNDLCVLHKCDNRPCCEPSHLFLGTYDDNNKDRASKGRSRNENMDKILCPKGHEYSGTNSRGDRICHLCGSEIARLYRLRRKKNDFHS